MRPVWTGSISFGLVNIPVRLHSAVQVKEHIAFRLLHNKDHSPIHYDRVCAKEGESVPWDQIVKGYEYSKGKFIILTDDDLKAAAIESSKAIEILDFVGAADVDPRFFETPYYLVPQKGGEKAYALLREAIKRTNTIGVGKVTLRSNAYHLAGIRAVDEALVLEIMRFADELVSVSDFSFPTDAGVRPQELQMAEQLVRNLSAPFEPAKYEDEYHTNVMRIIKAKMKGRKIDVEEPATPERTQVVDLMARLQESLEMGRASRDAGTAKRAPRERSHRRKRKTA